MAQSNSLVPCIASVMVGVPGRHFSLFFSSMPVLEGDGGCGILIRKVIHCGDKAFGVALEQANKVFIVSVSVFGPLTCYVYNGVQSVGIQPGLIDLAIFRRRFPFFPPVF